MYNISNLAKLKQLNENASDAMKAFWTFDKAAFAPGAVNGGRSRADYAVPILY
jgi:hypothetical protein